MADIFGIPAGAAGFVSLLVQIISSIDTLRDISARVEKAPAELSSLMSELICLKDLMKDIKHKEPRSDDLTLLMCHKSCETVHKSLEKLRKRVSVQPEGTRKPKILKLFAFRHWKEDVEALQRSILQAKMNLMLLKTCHNTSLLEAIMLATQHYTSSPPLPVLDGNIPPTSPVSPTPASNSFDQSEVDSHDTSYLSPTIRRRWNCAERHCSCSCHRTARIAGRFWAFKYTPLDVFRQTCDNKTCDGTKYGGTVSFALSQFGIRWSAIIQFHVLAAQGRLSLRPGFDVESVVPYTSPGFETLWKCENDLITFEDARDRLVDLYRSDPKSFKNHVNPGGKSYIEELVSVPWGFQGGLTKQFQLLELFMREFGMTRGTQSTVFLSTCAKWIGEGPQLELMETLLDLGFDATGIDTPHATEWPQPSSPNWIAEGLTPDPFFVEYQRMLLKDNQGFGNMTPLHEAVLLGSPERVSKWIPRSDKDEKNFLGQTPMHLATSNVKHLLPLVSAGHDLNATDNYGITPLMYAAAVNQEECLTVLLDAGANILLRDTRYNRDFLRYAAIHGHWNLILKILCRIEADAGKDIVESWAQYATIMYYVDYPDYPGEREVSFQELLAKCVHVNFTFDREMQNNTLLHYVRSIKDVEVLLEYGFTLINHVNSAGQHALMHICLHICRPDVVRRLLDAGAEIDLKDNLHHTTLYYILNKLQSSYEVPPVMEVARIILAKGADILCNHSCRCPCSPFGCFPSDLLRYAVYENYCSAQVPVWSLEWLNLLLEHRSPTEAKRTLLSFIRKAKFDEMGMTHVCCGRSEYLSSSGTFQKAPMPTEDIDEILEEESEFIDILENEMALSSAKGYETLLDDWILQIKASLENSCEKAVERNRKSRPSEDPRQDYYVVDYKKDRFVIDPNYYYFSESDPIRAVTNDVAKYISWMEHEYHRGNTISKLEKAPRDDWYFGRMSRLRRLVKILELPTAEIAELLRKRMEELVSNYGAMDVEESIMHFLRSWEMHE